MSSSLCKPSGFMPLLFVGVGALTILAGTPDGIGFEHDSVFYWSAAVGVTDDGIIYRTNGMTGHPPQPTGDEGAGWA